jgi:hypothetical protein
MSMSAQQYRALVNKLESIQEAPIAPVTPVGTDGLPTPNPQATLLYPNAPKLLDLFNQLAQLSDGEKENVVDALWKAYNSQSGRMGTKSLPPKAQSIVDAATHPTQKPTAY